MLVTQNRAAIARALRRGLAGFAAQEPISLREWAESHFYLSAESSYVEQRWEAWPFQRGILACIGSDDVHEVDVIKSARVGYTKILLAAVGYFAEHRRRNQVLWQPTDSARDEFVKTELDTMIRDVSVLHPIFPMREARHKDNTLLVKKFIGSMLHLRGGKSADNYRRLSVSVGYLDEFSSFDSNIDGEGDPGKLALKRLEGATFPKLVVGSTPKIKGLCLMEKRAEGADARYTYHIPCAHCDELHDLEWGGKGEPHGFKWVDDDPETVRHLCPHCGALATQGEYLAAAERGIWVGNDGTTIDQDGVFRDSEGNLIQPHLRVAFHVWTAYSPLVSWPKIVKEFLEAHEKASTGEDEELRTFWNTTLGRTWEGEIERMESDELQRRAEVEVLARVVHHVDGPRAEARPRLIEIAFPDGYLAKHVLNHWGVRSTGDFGEIVFNLIEIGQMRKTPDDRREDFDDVFDFVSVNMKNRTLKSFPQIRTIERGARVFGQSREADLIVDHKMDGAA